MSLLTHVELVKLVEAGMLQNVKPKHINAASIDLTLGPVLHLELPFPIEGDEITDGIWQDPVDLTMEQSIRTFEFVMSESGYVLEPGEFILASSEQVFNLPIGHNPEIHSGEGQQPQLYFEPAIAGEYKLKSTLARNGLGHLLAGWCDPGWSGSVLTLELHNVTRHHRLLIRPGMKIGQIIFQSGAPVPTRASYATTGQYNNDLVTTPGKGLR